MLEKMMPKGWRDLVDEAITRIIREEIEKQLKERFPEQETGNGTRTGFDYSMRQYINKRYEAIMQADPLIDEIIRDGLRRGLVKGFSDLDKTAD